MESHWIPGDLGGMVKSNARLMPESYIAHQGLSDRFELKPDVRVWGLKNSKITYIRV